MDAIFNYANYGYFDLKNQLHSGLSSLDQINYTYY